MENANVNVSKVVFLNLGQAFSKNSCNNNLKSIVKAQNKKNKNKKIKKPSTKQSGSNYRDENGSPIEIKYQMT